MIQKIHFWRTCYKSKIIPKDKDNNEEASIRIKCKLTKWWKIHQQAQKYFTSTRERPQGWKDRLWFQLGIKKDKEHLKWIWMVSTIYLREWPWCNTTSLFEVIEECRLWLQEIFWKSYKINANTWKYFLEIQIN